MSVQQIKQPRVMARVGPNPMANELKSFCKCAKTFAEWATTSDDVNPHVVLAVLWTFSPL